MRRNNHGSHANIGDLVELLNPVGNPTGIFGLVHERIEEPRLGDFDDSGIHRSFVMVTGVNHRVKDSLVRIVSFATN